MHHEYEKQACEATFKWYGWGSPVGLTIFFLGVSIAAYILRLTFFG